MERPATRKKEEYSLAEVCSMLSISMATGRNWIKLGKIQPAGERQGKPYFSAEYVQEMQKKLQREDTRFLKSRRNKKYISGNAMYRNYIPKDSPNFHKIGEMMEELRGFSLTDSQIRAVLAECAIQLLCQAYGRKVEFAENFLLHYSRGEIGLGQYDVLVQELLSGTGLERYTEKHCLDGQREIPEAFHVSFLLEKNVDILGLLYISLKNLGERKAAGSYYTPTGIVQKVIEHLLPEEPGVHNGKSGTLDSARGVARRLSLGANGRELKVLDPCCGTGNFLLQLPDGFSMGQIFGRDIDKISILAARINMALKFQNVPVSLIKEQIKVQDFLLEERGAYDVVLGNPPWGYQFGRNAEALLKEKFQTAGGQNIESYDVFLEQALASVPYGGKIAFVLPEAVLHVKSHLAARRMLLEQVQIERLEYLGNVFDRVQCPAVILQITKTKEPLHTKGMQIFGQGTNFAIQIDRRVEAENFNFHMTDEEYGLLEKTERQENIIFLKNQAEFALGIVTGNNRAIVQKEKSGKNEVVLKGKDIQKYKITPQDLYLAYEPEKFQQSAREEYYRAEEKLLYRFIGSQLVFAYDNQKRLSLNSCNILIPRVKHMDIKYILAVLNSRAAQFIYCRKFHSLKVLRTYLEHMPIPFIAETKQREIISLVEKIMAEEDYGKWMGYYDEIDRRIASAYGWTKQEYEKVCRK